MLFVSGTSDKNSNKVLFLMKIFGGYKSFLWSHWCPCFGLLVPSALGFKAIVNSLICILCCLCTTDSSDSPMVRHLLTSWWSVWQRSHFIHLLAYNKVPLCSVRWAFYSSRQFYFGYERNKILFKTADNLILDRCAVADLGFPRGWGANSPGGRQHTILPNFPKNCMKLKEFGPPGGRSSKILLCRSATDVVTLCKGQSTT